MMRHAGHPLGGSAASVLREIDEELKRLSELERVLATERELLLSAPAGLTASPAAGAPRRRRVSQAEIIAYLAEHPGSRPSHIADALRIPTTNVSTHL
jgi:hypothetical protein